MNPLHRKADAEVAAAPLANAKALRFCRGGFSFLSRAERGAPLNLLAFYGIPTCEPKLFRGTVSKPRPIQKLRFSDWPEMLAPSVRMW